MRNRVCISDPYREVCFVCRERRLVVALQFPIDLIGYEVGSIRLCQACATDVARRLLPAHPEQASKNDRYR